MSDAVFLTGATGYIGSYIAAGLLRDHRQRVAVLVRAASVEDAHRRLWRSLQLHMDFDEFAGLMARVDVHLGDLTSAGLGLEPEARRRLAHSIGSVVHCAASLNRKSDKACFNVNLRGTLEVLKLARDARDHHGLRRFSDISTVAVAGQRQDEVVTEDRAVEWDRSDYDPYARTKKFCEHMVHELLDGVPVTVFRPSIVLGDSRFSQTTQFDMVRAFVGLASLPVLPLQPDWKVDVVPADYVGKAVVSVHQSDTARHGAYHLSAGVDAPTYREIVDALAAAGHGVRPRFVPRLGRPFSLFVDAVAATPKPWGLRGAASLMQVFWPYLVFNTVFDNTRIREHLGHAPRRFPEYAHGLLRFAVDGKFRYTYRPWPKAVELPKVA